MLPVPHPRNDWTDPLPLFSRKSALLAATLAFATQAHASSVTNFVTNGSFENLTGTGLGNNSWNVFRSVPGWTTASGAGIELHNGNVAGVVAFDGKVKVELDSHNAHSNSAMIQKLNLAAGRYLLSFAYMGRIAGNPGDTNRIDYAVIGAGLQGTISKSLGAWEIVTAMFRSDGQGVTLRFGAGGRQDTLGGYIDSVAITASPVPLPAGLPLLGAALFALGLVKRRRQS